MQYGKRSKARTFLFLERTESKFKIKRSLTEAISRERGFRPQPAADQAWEQRPLPPSRTKAAPRERQRLRARRTRRAAGSWRGPFARRAENGCPVLVATRSRLILRQKWRLPTAPAGLRAKPRRRGRDPPWQMPARWQSPWGPKELPRLSVAGDCGVWKPPRAQRQNWVSWVQSFPAEWVFEQAAVCERS